MDITKQLCVVQYMRCDSTEFIYVEDHCHVLESNRFITRASRPVLWLLHAGPVVKINRMGKLDPRYLFLFSDAVAYRSFEIKIILTKVFFRSDPILEQGNCRLASSYRVNA